MVQVINAPERRPSFLQSILGSAVEELFPAMQKQREMQRMKEQMSKENQALQKMGIDLSGIQSPELRKTALAELLKQKGKENLFGKKEEFLNQLFSGNQNQSQPDLGQMQDRSFSEKLDASKISDEDILRATSVDPNIGRALQQAKDVALREKSEEEKKRTSKQKEFFKINEPKLMQLGEQEQKLKIENARYERLQNLFSDPRKFPSSFSASLFTKDGHINDIVYSQMTPEAQEAVKLIIDSTSNIKDSYGSRITNFDLGLYLKKLPSLLNSPEGKSRVLRDLKIMNELNLMHNQGIQEVFEEAGGTDQIPYSKAESLYKKKYGAQEKALIDEFISPKQKKFDDFPDANKYLGKKVKDTKTGEVFISDGNEWKPFRSQ